MQGYVHVYTGNGKGKTTAALGLAIRAAGAGKKVFFGQFVKSKRYHEIDLIEEQIPAIRTARFGRGCFIIGEPAREDKDAALEGLKEIRKIMNSGDFDIIILDEINIATYYDLIDPEEIVKLIREKPGPMELVLTGRYACDPILKIADIVTEMKEIKHYYQEGVKARKGIEY